MKILPILIMCALSATPICDYKVGNIVQKDVYSNISICSEGKTFREDITLKINTATDEFEVKPKVDIGYNPNIFLGNFIDNGLEQVLYSVESGGGGGYSFYQLYSFENSKEKVLFDSDDFKPTINACYNGNTVEIDYQGKKLFLDSTISKCSNKDDCSLYISTVNTILPYYNIALERYYLQVYQKVSAGYEANNLGYISSLLEINDDGYKIISIGTTSNFNYDGKIVD